MAPWRTKKADASPRVSEEEIVEIQKSFAHAYAVELLFAGRPTLQRDAIHASMQKYCGNVRMADQKDDSSGLHFFHLEHTVQYAEGALPAQCVVVFQDEKRKGLDLSSSLHQSWQWPNAKTAVSNSTTSLLITDLMASALDYKTRVQLFRGALRAVLENVNCVAIHWRLTEQFVDPQEFLASQEKSDIQSQLWGFINVRLFRIEGTDDLLMDTLGLAALGLPDLQCHFTGLEANDIARVLWNTSFYIYEHGDVIEDGHTVDGLTAEHMWKCQHEKALREPAREVLDINPGAPFAAGNRR